MMLLLVLFGGAIAGGLLAPLTWEAAGLGLLVLCVVRPLTGVIGLLGTKAPREERLVISFFGIRGIGSFYYLSHALNEAPFEGATCCGRSPVSSSSRRSSATAFPLRQPCAGLTALVDPFRLKGYGCAAQPRDKAAAR